MEEENMCEYISSRGFLKSSHIHSSNPISDIHQLIGYNFSTIYEGCSIYISTSCIPHFITLLHLIPVRFILITGDSDLTVPNNVFNSKNSFEEFINNAKIIHWYAQNSIIKHKKMTNLPIGLDYHTLYTNSNHNWGNQQTPIVQETELKRIKNESSPFYEREVKCYSNFHFALHSQFTNERIDAINNIPIDLVYYEPEQISRKESWIKQSKYAFVISPRGHGLDCHRTWEALCLGCIPIVKKSEIDDLYKDLPVLIVDDYKNITPVLLKNTIDTFKTARFNMDKMTLKYWTDKFSSHK
jgi:hypothetical protein